MSKIIELQPREINSIGGGEVDEALYYFAASQCRKAAKCAAFGGSMAAILIGVLRQKGTSKMAKITGYLGLAIGISTASVVFFL